MDDTTGLKMTPLMGPRSMPLQGKLRRGALVMGFAITTQMAKATDLPDVLFGIQMVESRGKDIGLHRDGITYGRYGVTFMAVRELQRIGWLTENHVDLSHPGTNERVATLYIKYLKSRYGSWWDAVRHYNPRSRVYARKVWAAMDRRKVRLAATR